MCAVIHAGTDLSSTVCKSPKPCLHRYCRGRLMLRDTPGRTERCMTCRPELCWFRIKMIDDCDYVSWVPSLTSRSIRRRLCAVAAPSVSSACLQGAPSVHPPVYEAPRPFLRLSARRPVRSAARPQGARSSVQTAFRCRRSIRLSDLLAAPSAPVLPKKSDLLFLGCLRAAPVPVPARPEFFASVGGCRSAVNDIASRSPIHYCFFRYLASSA